MARKTIRPAKRIQGELHIPGDKSISHRAAILGMLARGRTHITNFLTAEDCLNTLRACEQLGARVSRAGAEVWLEGCGLDGLKKPREVIDCGNSGTGVRLLSGVLAGLPFESAITGDEQIQRRPMKRIIEPLTRMGAKIESEPGGLCPLRIRGGNLQGITYDSPVASAQVKSCVLLAGLVAGGGIVFHEPSRSRDHTEKIFGHFGLDVQSEMNPLRPDGTGERPGNTVTFTPPTRPFQGSPFEVPGDLSSAAFFLAAAALLPDSKLTLKNIGINPTRTGILDVLDLLCPHVCKVTSKRDLQNEETADLEIVSAGPWADQDIDISQDALIPRLIDEIPILAVAATRIQAPATVVIRNAAELRVKETDRISVLARELRKIGVRMDELPDGMVIHGGPIRGGEADSHGDHRLAMSLAIAGLASEQGVVVHNTDCVNTSFPNFWELLDQAVVR